MKLVINIDEKNLNRIHFLLSMNKFPNQKTVQDYLDLHLNKILKDFLESKMIKFCEHWNPLKDYSIEKDLNK